MNLQKIGTEFTNRTRLDIISCIIQSAKTSKKTHIIYNCNLSVKQFNKFYELIAEAGLIKKTWNNGYEATDKGKKFLEDYHKIRSYFP